MSLQVLPTTYHENYSSYSSYSEVIARLKNGIVLLQDKRYNELSDFLRQNPSHRSLLGKIIKELANTNDFHGCAHFLEKFIDKIPNDQLLKLIDILRNSLFVWKRKFDMSSFQRCCFLLHRHFQMTEKFIRVMAKLYQSNQKRAQRRLYFWWIPLCYSLNRESGKRMMNTILNRIENMYKEEYPS